MGKKVYFLPNQLLREIYLIHLADEHTQSLGVFYQDVIYLVARNLLRGEFGVSITVAGNGGVSFDKS